MEEYISIMEGTVEEPRYPDGKTLMREGLVALGCFIIPLAVIFIVSLLFPGVQLGYGGGGGGHP